MAQYSKSLLVNKATAVPAFQSQLNLAGSDEMLS